MDDQTTIAEPSHDAGGTDRRSPPGPPRWVKVSSIVAAVVVLLVLILLLAGNDHRPGRHLDGGEKPPPGAEHSVQHP